MVVLTASVDAEHDGPTRELAKRLARPAVSRQTWLIFPGGIGDCCATPFTRNWEPVIDEIVEAAADRDIPAGNDSLVWMNDHPAGVTYSTAGHSLSWRHITLLELLQ